jgi:predicted transcriptional regulator
MRKHIVSKKLDVQKELALVESAKEAETNADYRQRYDAWRMRIEGYPVTAIAQELGVSYVMVYSYLKWIRQEHPEIVLDEFIDLSLERLDILLLRLAPGVKRGEVMAIRVSKEIIEAQMKLKGAYNVNHNVTAQVSFSVEGVDMGKV